MRYLTAGLVALALAFTSAPSLASMPPGTPPESYLYIVDADYIKVQPKQDGTRAKIIMRGSKVTRFSDRPYRHERRISVEEMFRDFGWDSETLKWENPTPNAGVSIAGHRTEIIDIRRAKGDKDRLVLHVRDVRHTLTAVEGAGAVFIDNVTAATTYPVTKSITWTQIPGVTADITATSATSLTVVFRTDTTTYDPVIVDSKTIKAYAKVDLPNGSKAEFAMTTSSAGCLMVNLTVTSLTAGPAQYVLGRCI